MATGAIQFALTGVAYDQPLGIITGGDWGAGMETEEREGVGGVGVTVGKRILPKVSLDLLPVDANCLIGSIKRATYPYSLPTAIPLKVGNTGRFCSAATWYCNAATITLEEGGALVFSGLEMLLGSKPTWGAGATAFAPGTTTFEYGNAAVTVGGSASKARRISIAIKNNLIPDYNLDTKTSGSRLYAAALEAGPEEVDIDVEWFTDPAHELSVDTLPTATLSCVISNNAGTPKTITATVTTPKVLDWSEKLVNARTRKLVTAKYRLDQNSGGLTLSIA